MLIVILGPDGCGKTTIADGLCEILSKRNISTHHLAMNFEILPKLRDIVNPFIKNKIVDTHIEGELNVGMKDKPNSQMKGVVLATWYAMDYFLGRFKLYSWNRNNDAVIFARYFYDYYFQRGHINTPHWYLDILQVLVPKPDFIFTITRDAQSIFDLKPELTVTEIQRQQYEIGKLLKSKKYAYTIDGKMGVDDTMQKIIKILDNK